MKEQQEKRIGHGRAGSDGVSADESLVVVQKMNTACRNLWASVLHRALKDIDGAITADWDEVSEFMGCHPGEPLNLNGLRRDLAYDFYRLSVADEAAEWFESDCEYVGSFYWICEALDLDRTAILIGARALLTTNSDMA